MRGGGGTVEITPSGLSRFLQAELQKCAYQMAVAHTGFAILCFDFRIRTDIEESSVQEMLHSIEKQLTALYAGYELRIWFESDTGHIFLEVRDLWGPVKRAGRRADEEPIGTLTFQPAFL
jgi:hypothetical protein